MVHTKQQTAKKKQVCETRRIPPNMKMEQVRSWCHFGHSPSHRGKVWLPPAEH